MLLGRKSPLCKTFLQRPSSFKRPLNSTNSGKQSWGQGCWLFRLSISHQGQYLRLNVSNLGLSSRYAEPQSDRAAVLVLCNTHHCCLAQVPRLHTNQRLHQMTPFSSPQHSLPRAPVASTMEPGISLKCDYVPACRQSLKHQCFAERWLIQGNISIS